MNNAIIERLYAEKKYRNLTKSICTKYGKDYAEDLHTEIVLRIIEKGDDLTQINDLFHYFFAFAHRTINEYKISKTVPDRLFLGAAENGPATWAGHRTVRAGPYNTVKFSRNATAETGGAKTQILRSDDAGKSWSFLKTGLPAGTEHMTCGFAIHPDDANTLCVGYTDGSV